MIRQRRRPPPGAATNRHNGDNVSDTKEKEIGIQHDNVLPSRLPSDVSDDGSDDNDDCDENTIGMVGKVPLPTTPSSLSSSSIMSHTWNTGKAHIFRLVEDFHHNGLPWKGDDCQSIRAGCSGILFSGAAFFVKDCYPLQMCWAAQGIVSVLADYVYIPCTSIWHGVDRILATFLLLFSIGQTMQTLAWWVNCLVVFPVGCFIQAAQAKQDRNLHQWHNWHCAWHFVASSVAILIMYLIYDYCPTTTHTNVGGPTSMSIMMKAGRPIMDSETQNTTTMMMTSKMDEWFWQPACQADNSVLGNLIGFFFDGTE